MGKFDKLYFRDFKSLAEDETLSKYNKIGFDDEYRQGFEELIFSDIVQYMPDFLKTNKNVLDIGPGCTDLPLHIIQMCKDKDHELHLIDSDEMLSLLPDDTFITMHRGMFPKENKLEEYKGYFDIIVVYSVLHHVFFEMNPYSFIDSALRLLSYGGSLFIGDIPNSSKKFRSNGIPIDINKDVMEDGFIFSILNRYRNMGHETYLVPHNKLLPLGSTRDNIVIVRGNK